MNLVGVDLAWKPERHPTALAAWLDDGRAVLAPALHGAETVRDTVLRLADGDSFVAVDAPLIVRNQHGQRACEAQLNARFRRHHAGAHPCNLRLDPEPAATKLAAAWRAAGFSFLTEAGIPDDGAGRWLAEVYPHPAQVTLLGRERIHAYKRGTVAVRRLALRAYRDDLRAALARHLPGFVGAPSIEALFAESIDELRGRALKSHEDALDACFCVLIAERLRLAGADFHYFGGPTDGFIAVPRR